MTASTPFSSDPTLDAIIEAYLDGQLSPEARLAFEARVQNEPALADELALQRRADESIRRQFQPPAVPALPVPQAVVATISPVAARPRFSRTLAAAAAILIAGAGVYMALNGSPFSPSDGRVSAQVAYERVVSGGFKPEWVCESAQQVADYTRERFGAPWTIDPAPGLTLVGWKYSHDLLSPDATMLLATQGDEKVVVVADHKQHDRRLRAADGLRVHKRDVGDLVIYEISHLPEPVVLGRVHVGRPTSPD